MIALLLLFLAGCGGGSEVRKYDTSLLHLGTGFNAKELCSCVFVVGQDPETCAAILKVSPDVARGRVDLEARTATSKALGGWARTARYVDEQTGCVLDPL